MIKKTEEEIMKNWRSDKQPLVSICCITFNHENFIATALDSILIQETEFPFEIIVRDDCSTDQTATIIKEYAKMYPHIIRTILEQENQYSKGVNPLIPAYSKAKGKYIAILEGDDYWRDELKLQKQVDFLDRHKEYALSYHNSIVIDEDNQIVSKARNKSPSDYSQDDMFCGNALIQTNTVMFRKVNNITSEKLDGLFNGDTILWHLLAYYGNTKYQEEIKYAAYRLHSGGVWSSLDTFKKFENSLITSHVLMDMLPDNYIKLKKRIENNMNQVAMLRLYKSIIVLDFKQFIAIVRLILKSEGLSIIKMFLRIPNILLNKIRVKTPKKSILQSKPLQ